MPDEIRHFPNIETERLLLRRPRVEDFDTIAEYRSDPEVVRYQDWALPYDRKRGLERLVKSVEQGGPTANGGWNLTVADRSDERVLGDLYLGGEWNGRSAEIGYTLAAEHWGQGYAGEAVRAALGWLFEDPKLARVGATLHPENTASAQLLERNGFHFEGRTRDSFWVGDVLSDDAIYGLTRSDWEAWNARPTGAPDVVRFVEVSEANQHAVRKLRVHHSQEGFVAPVAASMADALFPEIIDGAPVVPWMRAVEADGELAGFVMIAEVTDAHPEPYLWRLLIDRSHQRRGIGRRIIELLVEEVASRGSTTLMTSWVDGRGSPRPFYEGLGFVPTGEIIDDEIEGRLTFG
ncbi:MAG: GNAT family N-acetyltransferase [Actinomycetota bacterium]